MTVRSMEIGEKAAVPDTFPTSAARTGPPHSPCDIRPKISRAPSLRALSFRERRETSVTSGSGRDGDPVLVGAERWSISRAERYGRRLLNRGLLGPRVHQTMFH